MTQSVKTRNRVQWRKTRQGESLTILNIALIAFRVLICPAHRRSPQSFLSDKRTFNHALVVPIDYSKIGSTAICARRVPIAAGPFDSPFDKLDHSFSSFRAG